jgi:mono/diheme cytochrome c family protein
MKRVFKWVGAFVAVLILAGAGVVGWVQATWDFDHPDTPLPQIQSSADAETIARGEYIAHAVAHCSACHSSREGLQDHEVNLDAPMVGGYRIEAGPFGTYTAANLTSHASGVGDMTDAEIARVIRHGVGADGRLRPIMLLAVGDMSDEDLTAVVSWLRSLEPIDASRPGPAYGILAKALSRRFTPRIREVPAHVPSGDVSIERGRYLATGPAFCAGCHTRFDPMAGFAAVGPPFAGGTPEADPKRPDYEIVAPNLTPHPQYGHITAWSEDQFVTRLRAGRTVESSSMPWENFRRMTDEDLRSIYRYLRSLDPVEYQTGPTYRAKGTFQPS